MFKLNTIKPSSKSFKTNVKDPQSRRTRNCVVNNKSKKINNEFVRVEEIHCRGEV